MSLRLKRSGREKEKAKLDGPTLKPVSKKKKKKVRYKFPSKLSGKHLEEGNLHSQSSAAKGI